MTVFRKLILEALVRRRIQKGGQGYVEYILIVAVVGLVTTTALIAFQAQISAALGTLGTKFVAD